MSDNGDGSGRVFMAHDTASTMDGLASDTAKITPAERDKVMKLGHAFVERVRHPTGSAEPIDGAWMFLNGRFAPAAGDTGTDSRVKELLRGAFGYPKSKSEPINVLLNSPGGSLDSAYSTALYLSAYAKELRVFVPGRAKSASTLLAIGADRLYLSAFGELGPLDTQIADPRNPATTVSALDCYQSVEYVRGFGFNTIIAALPQLVNATDRQIPVKDLLETAATFAIGAITPVLSTITALDLGGWGRSLKIGEQYALRLLQARSKDGDRAKAKAIARRLVYDYTHHPFPIDYNETERIGLDATLMPGAIYDEAIEIVRACNNKSFVGFLNKEFASVLAPEPEARPGGQEADGHVRGQREGHQAEVIRAGEYIPEPE
jgi:Serine dehydrogenase proteinase